ncbi:MAG: hypothetical protein KBB61_04525 [Paludibacteraceae bacterium]|jgi:hypothetical protein|nr:hypothetical protein [Paludibacteraceae bacterium]MDI9537204.1 hypothetical protein [Bacteroidota bacterium]HHT61282.1 hypothetical protein [Bacteroidales bacterium]MBP9039220.1 hypothetical protein [Paludibacteraceae bacterium]HOA46303.1 hypothetical protein [Paludibacteraceae bacterium]
MIIAVDFDGTIVEHDYPAIGKPIPFAIDVLKRLQEECHHQLILWSVREGDLLDEAVEYCRQNGLEFYAVNKNYPEEQPTDGASRKLNANLYIDDRNVGGLPDWGVIYRMIKFGESFNDAYANNDMVPPKKNFFQKLFKL